jgi:C4-dicarboxylate-specific signal transduction histidine kinase
MAITRKTKNLATSKIEVEQVYIDQLKGTIRLLERRIEFLENRDDDGPTVADVLVHADSVQLVDALIDVLNTSDSMSQADTFRVLVRGLTPTQTETLLSVIAGA